MSIAISLEPGELHEFSVPHVLKLVGEHQHVLGAGCIAVATDLRVHALVQETSDDFSLSFGVGGGEGWAEAECASVDVGLEDAVSSRAQWARALGDMVAGDESALDGLSVHLGFGTLGRVCPASVLSASPAVAVAMAIAARAHRGRRRSASAQELAETACDLRASMLGGSSAATGAAYAECLLSVVGGAGHVEPWGESLNAQQLVPPDSFLLAIAPGVPAASLAEREERLRRALGRANEAAGDITGGDDASLGALFGLPEGLLDEQETTMLYGLLRVHQIADALFERLADPLTDNDVLAEACDEESAILSDYFGFPTELYAPVRRAAINAGALGIRLTWAFGGQPVVLIIAPGRRSEVEAAVQAASADVALMPLSMSPAGLVYGEAYEEGPPFEE